MHIAQRVFKKIERVFHQQRYARALPRILDAPAVSVGTMPFLLLSMVRSRDVLPYLVAVKSFTRYAKPQRIVIVCDPTITAEDRAVFIQRIPHVELRNAGEFVHEKIPRGGTRERLYAISEYCRHDYVVQLDAETVTMLAPLEVIRAITTGTGFVMSGELGSFLMNMEETAAQVSWCLNTDRPHVQAAVEASMGTCNLPPQVRYVRGCSGFTGFRKSDTMTEDMLAFSKTMQERHGARWTEWGTEQITSNYLVANASATTVLPFLSYGTPDVLHTESILTHFIGSMRFTSNKYRATTLRAVRQLKSELVPENVDVTFGQHSASSAT